MFSANIRTTFLVLVIVFLPSVSLKKLLDKNGMKTEELDDFSSNETVDQPESLSRAEKCYCRNGKCVEKDGQLVCQCNPEYGLYKIGECRECNCGKNMNCTFDPGYFSDGKACICSKGYSEVSGKCRGACRNNPCRNGKCEDGPGTSYECICPHGYYGNKCEIKESVTSRPKTSPFSRITESLSNTRTVSRFTSPKEFSKTSWYHTSTRFPTTSGCRCINGYCIPDTYGNWKCVCKPDHGLYGDGICIPCNCGPDTSCKFERNGLWLKKHCICQQGFQDKNGTCVELCNPRTCIHGQCEISDINNFCRCDYGYKGAYCNERIEKIMDDKIMEILEIQAPWILLTVLLLIILIAVVVINRNKNIKKNSFFFLNSDEKCPLFEDSKFANRLQAEVLE